MCDRPVADALFLLPGFVADSNGHSQVRHCAASDLRGTK